MAMLGRATTVLVAALAVALAFGMASAQGPAAAPGPAPGISEECFNAVLNMSDCLTYVTAGSTTRHPDKPCCPELAGLLESHPVCLCQLLSGGAESYGVSIDYKRALALPGICRLTAPPVAACAGTYARTTLRTAMLRTANQSNPFVAKFAYCSCKNLKKWQILIGVVRRENPPLCSCCHALYL